MALPIDIPTIISSIRLCVEIGQTVLCNKKEVGELVDDLDMVHDILDNLSSEVKERADQHKLYRVSKMLNYVTKKSFQIFNKLQRKKFTDRIRNTVAARAIKEDIQKLSSRLEKVVGYLNLVFNIQSAHGHAKGGPTVTIPDEEDLKSIEREAEMFDLNPTVDYGIEDDLDD